MVHHSAADKVSYRAPKGIVNVRGFELARNDMT